MHVISRQTASAEKLKAVAREENASAYHSCFGSTYIRHTSMVQGNRDRQPALMTLIHMQS